MRNLRKAAIATAVLGLATIGAGITMSPAGATQDPVVPAGQNFIETKPSCSLRWEAIPGDNDNVTYIYNGTNPTKTMWVTTGTPLDLDVFVHTFTEAGSVVGPKGAFVQYPTVNTWIPMGLLAAKCPPPEVTTTTVDQSTTTTTEAPTTTTTEAPTTTTTEAPTTTTSTPDQRVEFGCPEGTLVRMHFDRVDPLAGDSVTFTYVDSFGGTRQFTVFATVFDTFVFTGSGGPSDGLNRTATFVSVDTPGFVFAGFSCYQPIPVDEETTTTTAPAGGGTTTTVLAASTTTSINTNGNFTPAGFAGPGPVAVSPSTAELPFTGSNSRLAFVLGALLVALGSIAFISSRKVNRPVGS